MFDISSQSSSAATPHGWDASPSQVTPRTFSGCPNSLLIPILFVLLSRERHCESGVSCQKEQQEETGSLCCRCCGLNLFLVYFYFPLFQIMVRNIRQSKIKIKLV